MGSCLLPPFTAWFVTVVRYPAMPLLAKLAVYVFAALWVAGIAFSRVYLGAHSPLDVYGGMACSLLLGVFWYFAYDPIYAMVIQESFPFVAFFAPFFFLLVHPISTPGKSASASAMHSSPNRRFGCRLAPVCRLQ